MIAYFKSELKRYLRSKKFWIAFVLVFTVFTFNAIELTNKGKDAVYTNMGSSYPAQYSSLNHITTTLLPVNYMQDENDPDNWIEIYDERYPKLQAALETYNADYDVMMEALAKGDTDTYVEKALDSWAFLSALTIEIRNPISGYNYHKYDDEVQKIIDERGFGDLKEEILQVIDENWQIADWFYDSFPTAQFMTRYFYTLHEQGIAPINQYSVNSSTLWYQMCIHVLPFLIPVLILVMFFNVLDKDQKNGTLKQLLSLPRNTAYVIRGKILSSFVATVILVVTPAILLSGILAISDHFEQASAPVLIRESEVMQLAPREDSEGMIQSYYDYGQIDRESLFIGISEYTPRRFMSTIESPKTELNFTELWKFNIYSLGLIILYIAFLTNLFMLCTTITKNKIASAVLMAAIVVGGNVIVALKFTSKLSVINPFNFSNPVYNLSGLSVYYWPYAIIVLSSFTIGLYILNRLLFKRKRFY